MDKKALRNGQYVHRMDFPSPDSVFVDSRELGKFMGPLSRGVDPENGVL